MTTKDQCEMAAPSHQIRNRIDVGRRFGTTRELRITAMFPNSCQPVALMLALVASSMLVAETEKVPDPELAKLGAKILAQGWKASWSPDGKQIVYGGEAAPGEDDIEAGLSVLDLETGKIRRLVKAGKDSAWSPGKGEHIAYVGGRYGAAEEIWIVKSNGGKPAKLADGGYPSWASDAKTVFFQSRKRGKLMKIRTEVEKPDPAVVMDMRWYYPAISPDERHVAFRKGPEIQVAHLGTGEIVKRLPLPDGRGFLGGWSPNGRYLSYGGYGAHDVFGLWLADLQTSKLSRLPSGNFTMADWSRDGNKIAFDHRKPGIREVWMLETKALGDLLAKPREIAELNPEAIRLLVVQLGDDDFKKREQAAKSLLNIGQPAAQILQVATKDPDTEIELQLRAKKIVEQIALKERFGG